MRLWRGIAADPVGQPHDDCNHSKPSQSTRESADFLVLGEEAPLGEKNGPVARFGADEGQCPSVASALRQKKDSATTCVDTSRPEERALIPRGATSLPGHMP